MQQTPHHRTVAGEGREGRGRPGSALDALPAEIDFVAPGPSITAPCDVRGVRHPRISDQHTTLRVRIPVRPGTSQVAACIRRWRSGGAGRLCLAGRPSACSCPPHPPRKPAADAVPPAPLFGQGFATAIRCDNDGMSGMSRRNIKSLPGWKQFFDHKSKSYYWLNTHNHSSQWQHPVNQPRSREQVEADWDGRKASVKLRKDKVGIVMGAADHWLPRYANTTPDEQGPASLKTKQKVLAMIHRWAQKWDSITEAFRGMDINANGEVSRSQLRTALIRFNVSYNDALLETVWGFLDPEDTGVVKISKLTDFVFQNDPLKDRTASKLSQHATTETTGFNSQEKIQKLNVAAARNQFARQIIHNMPRLCAELSKVRPRAVHAYVSALFCWQQSTLSVHGQRACGQRESGRNVIPVPFPTNLFSAHQT